MKKIAYIILAALGFGSCNFLEIEPVGQVIPHKTSEFRALLTEGYYRFPYTDSKTYTTLFSDEVGTFYEGNFYSSDDALAYSYNYTWQYTTQMSELPYSRYYRAIFLANAVIDGVPTADLDTTEPREQILGEAYAIRAYSHFDLLNLYAKPYNPATAATDRGVPLATMIDIEQRFPPSTIGAVYTQILDDIATSEKLMSVERQTDVKINYRFSLEALQAFKARVLLYMGNWQQAYDAAATLLPKYPLVDLSTLTDKEQLPWVATSTEMVMAWERPFGGASGDLNGACLLSHEILDLFDRKADARSKYIVVKSRYNADTGKTDSLGYRLDRGRNDRTSIRVAELYLIAAEAAAHLPAGLADAKARLLELQAKRFTADEIGTQRTKIEAMNAEQLLAEIANDRARELLLEGHRWMDLRRTTRPQIVKQHLGSTYTLRAEDSRYTLPFPQSAINNNPDLSN